jgi:hypothetical protein
MSASQRLSRGFHRLGLILAATLLAIGFPLMVADPVADGFRERALFVIDRKDPIFWNYLSPVAVNPGADGILHALEQLSN